MCTRQRTRWLTLAWAGVTYHRRRRHVEPFYLAQWLELGLHDELVLAELTAASVRALDPLLETRLMDEAQASGAVARRDQRALVIAFTVTNPTGDGEHGHTSAGVRRREIPEKEKEKQADGGV